MLEGLLWYDDSNDRDLTEKINRVVEHYTRKYRHAPDAVYVHPSAIDSEREIDGVKVAPLPSILLHHFWIGREREDEQESRVTSIRTAGHD